MAKKIPISIRLDEQLLKDTDEIARSYGFSDDYGQGGSGGKRGRPRSGRTRLIEEMLEALRDGRLFIRPPEGLNAFPAEEIKAGEDPEFPILVCLDPTTASED